MFLFGPDCLAFNTEGKTLISLMTQFSFKKIAVFLFFFLTFNISLAHACGCTSTPLTKDSLNDYEAVFSGTVTDIEEMGKEKDSWGEQKVKVTFNVIKWWKGQMTEQITLHTVLNTSSCNGYYFEKKQSYLIFSFKNKDGTLGTSICNHNSLLKDADKSLAVLGKGHPPQKK